MAGRGGHVASLMVLGWHGAGGAGARLLVFSTILHGRRSSVKEKRECGDNWAFFRVGHIYAGRLVMAASVKGRSGKRAAGATENPARCRRVPRVPTGRRRWPCPYAGILTSGLRASTTSSIRIASAGLNLESATRM